jgi:hypothetical protein
VEPFDDTLFAEQLSAEEKSTQKFDDMFIGYSQLARLDFFYRKKLKPTAYQAYYDACKIASVGSADDRESCEVLENAISNLIYSNRYPLPLDLRAAILAEKQKRAATPVSTFEKSNSTSSPEDAELHRSNAEYVEVHFQGVALEDVHADQNERFHKARQKHPKLRGPVEIDFLTGSIEQREKILADAENLPTGPADHLRRPGETEKQKRTAAPAPTTSNGDNTLRIIRIMERKIQELEGKLSATQRELNAALDRKAKAASGTSGN